MAHPYQRARKNKLAGERWLMDRYGYSHKDAIGEWAGMSHEDKAKITKLLREDNHSQWKDSGKY